jgi:hypothetical protein
MKTVRIPVSLKKLGRFCDLDSQNSHLRSHDLKKKCVKTSGTLEFAPFSTNSPQVVSYKLVVSYKIVKKGRAKILYKIFIHLVFALHL